MREITAGLFITLDASSRRRRSGTLVRFLLQQGLLDELNLLVHPVVVGIGKHLFEGGTGQVPLKLLESRR